MACLPEKCEDTLTRSCVQFQRLFTCQQSMAKFPILEERQLMGRACLGGCGDRRHNNIEMYSNTAI